MAGLSARVLGASFFVIASKVLDIDHLDSSRSSVLDYHLQEEIHHNLLLQFTTNRSLVCAWPAYTDSPEPHVICIVDWRREEMAFHRWFGR